MTTMPEMVALLNGSGGIASLLVGWAVYHFNPGADTFTTITIFLSVLIGGWAWLITSIRYSREQAERKRQTYQELLIESESEPASESVTQPGAVD